MAIIRLSLNGRSLELSRFSSATLPRRKIQDYAIEQSVFGTPYQTGPSYETLFQLTLSAYVTTSEEETLRLIWGDWDANRTQFVQVEDYTALNAERTPRSRQIASGAFDNVDGPMTLYFPRLFCHFQSEPEYTQEGIYRVVTATLQEASLTGS